MWGTGQNVRLCPEAGGTEGKGIEGAGVMIELDLGTPELPERKKRLPLRLNQHQSRVRMNMVVANQRPVKKVDMSFRTPEEWRRILDEAKRGARDV